MLHITSYAQSYTYTRYIYEVISIGKTSRKTYWKMLKTSAKYINMKSLFTSFKVTLTWLGENLSGGVFMFKISENLLLMHLFITP